ncbi:MAG: riboflavin synthase [Spirochaetales bacterium]|nr:riboflavin synthase [Spirochaetales bacterium]
MFTGIVEEIGRVLDVRSRSAYRRITIRAHAVLDDAEIGDSIALDGACQTVVRIGRDAFDVETLAVSLEKTTLGSWRVGRAVNLERALTPAGRLGGHFVQGHIDGTARIVDIRREGDNGYLTVDLPP